MNGSIYKFYAIFACCLLAMSGCAGRKAYPEQEQSARIGVIESKKKVAEEKFDSVQKQGAPLAYATGRLIERIGDQNDPATKGARQTNSRVENILGTPSYAEKLKMDKMVGNLTSKLEKDRQDAQKTLEQKDKEILESRQFIEALKADVVEKEQNYVKLSEKTAKDAEEFRTVNDQVNSWMGLGGIWYGAKRFVGFSFWIIVGIALLLVGLWIASMFFPILIPIFSIIWKLIMGLVNAFISVFGLVGKMFTKIVKTTDNIIPESKVITSTTPTPTNEGNNT